MTLVDQASYDDTWQKYEAGLTNGQLPDVVQIDDQRTPQVAIDTQSIRPGPDLHQRARTTRRRDFLARALAYWKVGGVQQGMPFAVSDPVLYYNKQAFTEGRPQPEHAAGHPGPVRDRRQDAQGVRAAALGLKLDPWHLETWLATANAAVREQRQRPIRPGHQGRLQQRHGQAPDLHRPEPAGEQRLRRDQPVAGRRATTTLLGIGIGQVRHDHRHVCRPRHHLPVLSSGQYPNVTARGGPLPGGQRQAPRGASSRAVPPSTSRRRSSAGQPGRRLAVHRVSGHASPRPRGRPAPATSPSGSPAAESATVQQLWATTPELQGGVHAAPRRVPRPRPPPVR